MSYPSDPDRRQQNQGFGSKSVDGLFIGRLKGDELIYAGKVDRGFDDASADDLQARSLPVRVLQLELAELASLDVEIDPTLTGFSTGEIDVILSSATDPDDEVIPPVPATPRTKPGGIWILGDHRVGCGDGRDAGFLQRIIGDGARWRYLSHSATLPLTRTRSGLSALMIGPGGAITDTPALSATWKGAGWSPCCRTVSPRPPRPGSLLIPRSRSSPVTAVEDMAKPQQGPCRTRYRSQIVGI